MSTGQIKNPDDVRNYITGGSATFTLVSGKTNNRFTYRTRPGQDRGWFIDVLSGPDNTKDYEYVGFLFLNNQGDLAFKVYSPQRKQLSAEALSWLFQQLNKDQLSESVEFWHSGRCARCGRRLTTPESIERGIGPVCATRV